jgi:diguanylate cyclase (GGDEF)-like protein/PAS domain S-box-containing protein
VNVVGSSCEPNRRILIVDDNLAIHEDIVKVLAGTDAEEQALDNEETLLFETESAQTVQFQIDSAFQGQEGLEKVRAAISDGNPYAMAFVDIRMPPGWDGVETIGHLWKADPSLQVVICTAYSDYSWNEMRRHLGSSDSLLILKKPFDNIEVTQLAHALTRKWAVTRQAEEQTVKLQSELVSRIQTECDLRASRERYLLAARGTNDGIWDWDLESRAIYFAPRWKEMLGFAEHEIEAEPGEWLSRVHPEDKERLQAQLDTCMKAGGSDDFISEHRIRHKDGTWRWMLNRAVVLRSPEGAALRIAGSQTDVTKNKAFDALTTLPNRVLFIESVARALELRKHGSIPSFGVMFVDLDGFKDVNDSLGHSAGDQLLIEVARRLEDTVRADAERRRSTYVLARLGGDEFAVLIGDVPGHKAAVALAAEIQRVLNQPFVLQSNNIAISASIGIALWNQACETPEEMLQDADTAMYRAKKLGRARAVVFDAAMRAETMNRIELTGDLRLALTAGELIVYYQPIFRLSDTNSGATGHRLAGFEALARWRHPTRGLVMPREFIPVAEESGLIMPLGDIVLREACSRMKRWHDLYPRQTPADLSVNLSPSQLRDPNLVQRVAAVLAETGFDPRHLKLEITEAVRIHDFPSVLASVNALKEMGIALEIDDFGTGYSCLSWLPTLRCKSLKIDYSFVTGMMHDVHSLEIIRAIVGLAQSLNMNVIAEGIETKTQLDVLRGMGCWFGQGFYLSRPLSADDAERMMADSAIEDSRPAGMDFSALLAAR